MKTKNHDKKEKKADPVDNETSVVYPNEQAAEEFIDQKADWSEDSFQTDKKTGKE